MNASKVIVLGLIAASVASAELVEISDAMITQNRGKSSTKDGVRIQTGELDATGHGPISLYAIPFQEGLVSFSWKVDIEQKVMFLLDGKKNGKATHHLKVYFNGRPGKKSKSDQLTILTYDGSTKQKKKATLKVNEYYAKPGQWHKTSIAIKGSKATIKVNDQTYVVSSEKFLEGVQRIGIGNFTGSLYTKDMRVEKLK